jgi:hypothetical protein
VEQYFSWAIRFCKAFQQQIVMMSHCLEHEEAGLSHCNPAEHSFLGSEAQREICGRLSGYPLAQQLSRDIHNFYGDHLHFVESRNFTSTLFTIRLQHQPIALKSAEIRLQSETDRVAEALAHELLHLRLFSLGFPLGEFIQIPVAFDPYAREFIGMCHWVLNAVQHEMNYQNFIALGFDKNHFLVRSNAVMNYRERFRPELHNSVPAQVEFPRWCIEYLSHFSTARHGGGGESLDQAQDALFWGSRLYPRLRVVTAEIRKWFEEGLFKEPAKYPGQVNFLLELMGIPKFTGWARIELSHQKKPMAVRLEPRLFSPSECGEGDFWETPFGIQWFQGGL